MKAPGATPDGAAVTSVSGVPLTGTRVKVRANIKAPSRVRQETGVEEGGEAGAESKETFMASRVINMSSPLAPGPHLPEPGGFIIHGRQKEAGE